MHKVSLYLIAVLSLFAQYDKDFGQFYNYSELYNERSLSTSNSFTRNGNINITEFSGGLNYTYPIFNLPIGPKSKLSVSLHYNSQLAATSSNFYSNSSKYLNTRTWDTDGFSSINAPGWILSVNGVAVQLFNWETQMRTLGKDSRLGVDENFVVSGDQVNRIFKGWHYNYTNDNTSSRKNINLLDGSGGLFSFRHFDNATIGDEYQLMDMSRRGILAYFISVDPNGPDGDGLRVDNVRTGYEKNVLVLEYPDGKRVYYAYHLDYMKDPKDLETNTNFNTDPPEYNHYVNTGGAAGLDEYNAPRFKSAFIPWKIVFADKKEVLFEYDMTDRDLLMPSLTKIKFNGNVINVGPAVGIVKGQGFSNYIVSLEKDGGSTVDYTFNFQSAVHNTSRKGVYNNPYLGSDPTNNYYKWRWGSGNYNNNHAQVSSIIDPEGNATNIIYEDYSVVHRGLYAKGTFEDYTFARNTSHDLKRIKEIHTPSGEINEFTYLNLDVLDNDGDVISNGITVKPQTSTNEYFESEFYKKTGREIYTSSVLAEHKIRSNADKFDKGGSAFKKLTHYYYYWFKGSANQRYRRDSDLSLRTQPRTTDVFYTYIGESYTDVDYNREYATSLIVSNRSPLPSPPTNGGVDYLSQIDYDYQKSAILTSLNQELGGFYTKSVFNRYVMFRHITNDLTYDVGSGSIDNTTSYKITNQQIYRDGTKLKEVFSEYDLGEAVKTPNNNTYAHNFGETTPTYQPYVYDGRLYETRKTVHSYLNGTFNESIQTFTNQYDTVRYSDQLNGIAYEYLVSSSSEDVNLGKENSTFYDLNYVKTSLSDFIAYTSFGPAKTYDFPQLRIANRTTSSMTIGNETQSSESLIQFFNPRTKTAPAVVPNTLNNSLMDNAAGFYVFGSPIRVYNKMNTTDAPNQFSLLSKTIRYHGVTGFPKDIQDELGNKMHFLDGGATDPFYFYNYDNNSLISTSPSTMYVSTEFAPASMWKIFPNEERLEYRVNFDDITGKPLDVVNNYGLKVSYRYDELDRIKQIFTPNHANIANAQINYDYVQAFNRINYSVRSEGNQEVKSTYQYDPYGRFNHSIRYNDFTYSAGNAKKDSVEYDLEDRKLKVINTNGHFSYSHYNTYGEISKVDQVKNDESQKVSSETRTTFLPYYNASGTDIQEELNVYSYESGSDQVIEFGSSKFAKTVSTDANGIESWSYKDPLGNVLLTIGNRKNNDVDIPIAERVIVKYYYNDKNQLYKVVHPNETQTLYSYDSKYHTLKSKSLPSQTGSHKYAYDYFGRLRFSQDPNQSAHDDPTKHSFTFFGYDILGRQTYTGINENSDQFSTFFSNDATLNMTVQGFESDINKYLGVTFYDESPSFTDPIWNTLPNVYEKSNTQYMLGEATYVASRSDLSHPWSFTWTEKDIFGRLTDSHRYNSFYLDDGTTVAGTYVKNIYSYDRINRQTALATHIKYNNDLLKEHSYAYVYDELNRITSISLNGTNVATYTYNVEGQLEQNSIGNGLQSVDYTYNYLGWVSSINDVENAGSDLFSQKYFYFDGLNSSEIKQFNGNISKISTLTPSLSSAITEYKYSYDSVNRLAEMVNGEGLPSGAIQATFEYEDTSGNLKKIVRKGVK